MVSSPGKRAIPSNACKATSARSQLVVCEPPCSGHHREQEGREGFTGSMALGEVRRNGRCWLHRLAIAHLPQKLKEHHQPTERCDRSLGLAQIPLFFPPKER